jgi:hypothetical protein
MRPEIYGFVRVSVVVVGPWCRQRSAKQGSCRQAADHGGDREAMMTPSGVCRRRARNRTNYNSCANREGDQSFFITRPPLLRFDENRASPRFDVVRNARPTAFPSIGTGLALASVNDRLAVIGSDLTKRLPKLIAVMARRVRFCLLRGAVLGKTSTPVRSDSKRRTSMAVMLN